MLGPYKLGAVESSIAGAVGMLLFLAVVKGHLPRILSGAGGAVAAIRKFLNIPGSLFAMITLGSFVAAGIFVFTNIQDQAAYWASIALFVVGIVISYHLSHTAGFDGALHHFKEVIIGSTNIGLTSIKKISDLPPSEMVKQTNSSLQFIGVAGGKFLKSALDNVDFFRSNQSSPKVRFILMDPFSKDIVRLTRDIEQQQVFRKKIIQSIVDLAEKSKQGYRFEVRLYPKVPPLRLMICDGVKTSMSVYNLEESGWKNAQLVFDSKNCPDSLAPHFNELFDDLWERALGFNLTARANALAGLLSSEMVDSSTTIAATGMVHGRFQPFHHEHLEYILHGITHSKKCLIGITQPKIDTITECAIAPHRGKKEGNPFSFEERKDMIRLSLKAIGVPPDRYEIIEFDVDKADVVLPHLRSQYVQGLTHFVKIFSEWEIHKKSLFLQHQFQVEIVRDDANQYSQKNVSGTLVRELIASKRNWEDFVPPGTCSVIRSCPQS